MSLVFNVISMLGGLAMFLYGMNLLGGSLEKVSGGRLEQTLEKMTSNIFKGVLVGLVVTAAIQSSSATTVIVVGLVNAGILKLRSAVGVIMGANIGNRTDSASCGAGQYRKRWIYFGIYQAYYACPSRNGGWHCVDDGCQTQKEQNYRRNPYGIRHPV